MKNLFLLIISFVFFIQCKQAKIEDSGLKAGQKEEVLVLTKEEFKAAISNKKVQLVDVRTADEFSEGYINRAINIDYNEADFKERIGKLNKAQAVYLYCQSGGRSHEAAKLLKNLGFKYIYELEAGYINYVEE